MELQNNEHVERPVSQYVLKTVLAHEAPPLPRALPAKWTLLLYIYIYTQVFQKDTKQKMKTNIITPIYIYTYIYIYIYFETLMISMIVLENYRNLPALASGFRVMLCLGVVPA